MESWNFTLFLWVPYIAITFLETLLIVINDAELNFINVNNTKQTY